MSSTTFTAGTLIESDWLNDVNNVVYSNSVQLVSGDVSFVPNLYTFGDGAQNEYLVLDGGTSKLRLMFAQTNGSSRWAWGANETAEAGSEAGSDWVLHAYDDSGNYTFSPMIVYRATGMLQLNNNVVMKPGSTAPVLGTNGQVTFELTNNTTLTFKARGSDGTTRSGTITLS